ncbi:hypothetical protein EZS27_017318 [termite gut metagenome]|uniref:site-specific DNA-methyltransferase (adenine-specific) n=1 Tax=termite gut metagenome TaxID=433724 RepID=A0A5J4RJM3_9ZZZZ
MDKNKAATIIEETFDKAFDKEAFIRFVKNLLNDMEDKNNDYWGQNIKEAFQNHIFRYSRIGKYTDPDGKALDVLVIEVSQEDKLNKARTSLRNFVIEHLKTFGGKDYALAAFYSKTDSGRNWRFSFIKREHYTDVKADKIKQREEFTPALRYSFLVGKDEKSHTAKRQLLPLLQNVCNNPTIEDIEKAFSIEVVTDEFFGQYKDLFFRISEHLNADSRIKSIVDKADTDISRFTKKLLGQIVFLYFLQKKGWLGVLKNGKWGTERKDFLQSLYNKTNAEGKNFFNACLRYLFYEALARQHGEDNYYARLDCRIPFLNGGLFEADYDWEKFEIELPNTLFRNNETVSKTSDIGTGILDVFDRYNFTIRENEPLEKEVAIDPEMLGKVFENMLEITERKSKGAFYTPREIVHYMCQESLIHYLDNACSDSFYGLDSQSPVAKSDIDDFVHNGFFYIEHDTRVGNKGKETDTYSYKLPESIRKNADIIDKLLTDIKICDPAIGSGAFPVGLLNELVTLQLVLFNHLSNSYLSQKLNVIGLKPEEYDRNPEKYLYRVKRHNIQESIYGVDIDASAIDIARLRLWLSLVVDEEDFDNIETLPNLDYKIVCGNSLIGMPESMLRDDNIKDEIEKLKDTFFAENNEIRKKELRTIINKKLRALLDSAEEFAGYEIDFDFKLFFSEVWKKRDGFDMVIGNPPYGAKLSTQEKILLKNMYPDVHMRTPDTFNYFISKGLSLLKQDKTISFIVPNNLLFQHENTKTRALLINANQLYRVINLGDNTFAHADVPTCIFVVIKRQVENYEVAYSDDRKGNIKNIDFYRVQKLIPKLDINDVPDLVIGVSSGHIKIMKDIEAVSLKIDDIALEMASGISTGGDKVFRITKQFAKENNFELELLKPVLIGGEIDKYKIKNTEHVIIYTDRSTDIHSYKTIEKYLYNYKSALEKRSEAQKGVMPWFSLNRQRYPLLFEEKKIIMRQTSDSIRASIDIDGFYCLDSLLILKVKEDSKIFHKYALVMLNSKLNNFVYKNITQEEGRTFAQVKPQNVRKLYVPKISIEKQKVFETLCDYLLFLNNAKNNPVNTRIDNTALSQFFQEIVDVCVVELIYGKEMEQKEVNILKYVRESIKPITHLEYETQQAREIFKVHYEWSQPESKIRNRMKIISLMCPETVGIILSDYEENK